MAHQRYCNQSTERPQLRPFSNVKLFETGKPTTPWLSTATFVPCLYKQLTLGLSLISNILIVSTQLCSLQLQLLIGLAILCTPGVFVQHYTYMNRQRYLLQIGHIIILIKMYCHILNSQLPSYVIGTSLSEPHTG